MREDIQQLVRIQDLDQKIATLEKDLERIPKEQALAHERLANDEASLANAKSAYQQNEIATKNLDLDRQTRKTTIEKLKVQQFETKKNDEYDKLGAEVKRYEEMVDDLETQELELMEKSDECQATIADAKASLAKTQGIVDEEIAVLDQRAEANRTEISSLKETRTEEVTKVEEDLLNEYDRLFKKREGKAVCKLTPERTCTSCNVSVTPGTFADARSGETIAECDNCGAILYIG